MSIAMNEQDMKALVAELAKNTKTEKNLSDFSIQLVTKVAKIIDIQHVYWDVLPERRRRIIPAIQCNTIPDFRTLFFFDLKDEGENHSRG